MSATTANSFTTNLKNPIKTTNQRQAKYEIHENLNPSTGQPPNPYDSAGFLSRSTFFWMNQFIKKGFSRLLTLEDFYEAPRCDLSSDLGEQLRVEWDKELVRCKESTLSSSSSTSNSKKQPSLLRAIWRAFSFWYILVSLIEMLSECIARPLQAVALGWLINDVNKYLNARATLQASTQIYIPRNYNDSTSTFSLARLESLAASVNTNFQANFIPNHVLNVSTLGREESLVNLSSNELLEEIYWNCFKDGLVLIVCAAVSVLTMHPFVFTCQHIGMKIRIACCQLIYRHSLKLTQESIGQTTAGQLVNLLSNDVNRFDIALNYLPYLIIAPIQALTTFTVLSTLYLGFYPSLAGAGLLLIYVPFQTLMGRLFGKLRQVTAIRTDERIRLMNEIVPAMRVIKMYTWEVPFSKLVAMARGREMKQIRRTAVLRGINMALFFVSSKFILFIALITYVLLGYSLDPQMVFVSIAMLHAVRLYMTLFFPYGVAQLAETMISIRRLQTFLLLAQQQPSSFVTRRPVVEATSSTISDESCKHTSNKQQDIDEDKSDYENKSNMNLASDQNKQQQDADSSSLGSSLLEFDQSGSERISNKLRIEFRNVSANWIVNVQGIGKPLMIGGCNAQQRKLANYSSIPTTNNTNKADTKQKFFNTGKQKRSASLLGLIESTTNIEESLVDVMATSFDVNGQPISSAHSANFNTSIDVIGSETSLLASTQSIDRLRKSTVVGIHTHHQHHRRHSQHSSSPYLASDVSLAVQALRNVNFELRTGELLVVAGRVGSGKSSVLMTLLGELPLSSGEMTVIGSVSYSSQNAWIFAGSVRDNILFGQQYNEARYAQVLQVCSLTRDLEILPHGDETIVGERGVSLSGGQRARVNLARAVYREADIYLLDDPLSAVDTLVARHIYNECIASFLSNKSIVLATHQTQFVTQANARVLFLENGHQVAFRRANECGELLKGAPDSSTLTKDLLASEKATATATATATTDSDTDLQRDSLLLGIKPANTVGSQQLSDLAEKIAGDEEKDCLVKVSQDEDKSSLKSLKAACDNDNLSKASSTSLGAVDSHYLKSSTQTTNTDGSSIYLYYVAACKSVVLIGVWSLANILTQALFNGTDFWLSFWTDSEQRRLMDIPSSPFESLISKTSNATTLKANITIFVKPATNIADTLTRSQNAIVYTSLVGGLFAFSLLRTSCFFVACTRASVNLHNRLFSSVLNAPIRFFDYNPIGVLLNRISKDMGTVDDLLPATAFDTIEIFFNVSGILITVGFVYPLSLAPAFVLCCAVFVIRLLYMRTVRSIKTIEGVTRSPVFSHLATSLNGLATIRAFKMEPDFEHRFDQYQDIHTSAWFLFVASSRWLCSSLDWLSNLYIAVLTLTISLTVGNTSGSQVGLAVSTALAISGSFQWGVRQSTELESYMTSVQRIKEYCELPEEEPQVQRYAQHLIASLTSPSLGWPQFGGIEFVNVCLKYFKHEAPVLRNLSFMIKPKEKIGIVGRTGAGKSSIIAALFRLTEPSGAIKIDGVDISSLRLVELRKRLSIIPQEPILFSGTVRRNLDPFDEYADADIWSALQSVQLSKVIMQQGQSAAMLSSSSSPLSGSSSSSSSLGLESPVSEGGANFSVGQRQLMCLARAILRRNRVLILDEATANVDQQTDKFIQRTIRKLFKNCTVITIAHRLNTIMDCDRVLVLDAGQLREFDEPHVLITKYPNGLFATMTANTGSQANKLRRLAERAHKKRQLAA